MRELLIFLFGVVFTIFISFLIYLYKKYRNKNKITSQNISKSVVESTKNFVAAYNAEKECIYLNPGAYQLTGYDKSTGLDLPFSKIASKKDEKRIRKNFDKCLEFQSPIFLEVDIIRADGSVFHGAMQAYPMTDVKNEAVGIVAIIQDITDRINAQSESEDMNKRLALALKASKSGVWDADIKNNIIRFDTEIAGFLGIENGRLSLSLNELHDRLIKLSDEKSANSLFDRLVFPEELDKDHNRIYRFLHKTGKEIYTKLYTARINTDIVKVIGISQDITEDVYAERALIFAKDAAEHATQAKSQFLSNMSHEIRTPMNAIIGMTKIAYNTEDMPKIRDCLGKVLTSSEHLLNIINDILDLSKIESGKFELFNEEFDLEEVLQSIVNIISVKVTEKSQELFIRIDKNTPKRFFGDMTHLTQILMNLLSNAIKFTQNEGRVGLEISTKEQDEAMAVLEFVVTDNGIGITPEQQERLFSSFEQADNSIKKKYGGTGLGLAISKRLIELMGGSIHLESEMSKGSKFIFTVKYNIADSSEAAFNIVQKNSAKQLRVLVVDDSKEICEYMKSIFETQAIRCKTVYNGYDAISAVQKAKDTSDPFNVIFIDLKMDGIDGIEATKRIKAIGKDAPVIILMSMHDMEKIETTAKEAGISKLIPKPLFPSSIINTLNEIIGVQPRKTVDKPLTTVRFTDKRILIVEDLEINRDILCAVLDDTGILIDTATNGIEAVAAIQKNPTLYDLVFMDIQMPGMDGYTATEIIRKMDNLGLNELPIIAMTANAFTEDIQRALASGMNGHLSKPINEKEVMSQLLKYLGGTVVTTSEEDLSSTKNTSDKNDSRAIKSSQALDSPSSSLSSSSLESINKFVNLNEGLKILNGNKKLFVRLLTSFTKNGSFEEFISAIKNKDYQTAQNKAHAIKGVTANLSISLLFQRIKEIETDLRNDEKITYDDDRIETLEQIFSDTKDAIREITAHPELLD